MNNDIFNAFMTRLRDAALGYRIEYPNVTNDNAVDGEMYLRVTHFPNIGIDSTHASQFVVRQGLFQVEVVGRTKIGVNVFNDAASAVASVFPKLTPLVNVIINRQPYISSVVDINGHTASLPLTIPYSG